MKNYEKIDNLDVVLKVKEALDLTYGEINRIFSVLEGYKIYAPKKEQPKRRLGIAFRLSTGLFFLIAVAIMFFVVMPIKWLITGNYFFDHDNKVSSFMERWKNRL